MLIKALKISFKTLDILKWVRVSTSKMEHFPVQPYQIGQRLDRYLKKSPLGWTSGQKLLRKKDILVCKKDGSFVNQGEYRLQQGDTILVAKILKQKFGKRQLDEQKAIPREQATRILNAMTIYDNQSISVINKPPGFSVQGGLNPHKNLFSLMSSKYKKELIHVTHRLDRGTSGLVIFAKNKQNAQFIQMAMQDKSSFNKYYLALTQGKKQLNSQAYIRGNIQWTGKNKARMCSEDVSESKDCTTFYSSLKSQNIQIKNQKLYRNLLGIKLLTGRKHQIRCHLSDYLEQPILNDSKYGGYRLTQDDQQDSQIFLHAFGIQIRKRELIDRIRTDKKNFFNQKLGSVKVFENKVIFIANLPQNWASEIKIDLNLMKLLQDLKKKQQKLQGLAPKKRNITRIK